MIRPTGLPPAFSWTEQSAQPNPGGQRFRTHQRRSGESTYWNQHFSRGINPDGVIAQVKLMDNDIVLGQWSQSYSNYLWASPAAGLHQLRAIATDDLGG